MEKRYFRVKCIPQGEHNGRHRAGLFFPKGESVHEMTREQFEAVQKDSALAITAELPEAEGKKAVARPPETEEKRHARELGELRAMLLEQSQHIEQLKDLAAKQARRIEELEAQAKAKKAEPEKAEGKKAEGK
jgi:hypothetical protein